MSIYTPDPDKDCCFCRHAQRTSGNAVAVDDTKELYCPVKQCFVDYDRSVETGTECEDRDTLHDDTWVRDFVPGVV